MNLCFLNTALLLLIGLCFFGCGNSNHNTDSELGRNNTELEFNKYVDRVSLTRIIETNDMMLADISKVLAIDDSTDIFMDPRQHALLKLTSDGRIVDKFRKIGRGPQEYLGVLDFALDTESGKIFLLCEPFRLIITDTDFNITNIVDLNQDFRRIAYYQGAIYLYRHNTWSVCRLDNNFEPLPYINSERSNAGVFFSPQPVFHETKEGLLVNMAGDDAIYKIEDGEYEKYFTLNFPDKEKSYSALSKASPDDTFTYAQNAPPRILSIALAGDGNIRIIYSFRMLFRMALVDVEANKVLDDGVITNVLNYVSPTLNVAGNPSAFFFVIDSLINSNLYEVDYYKRSREADAVFVTYELK